MKAKIIIGVFLSGLLAFQFTGTVYAESSGAMGLVGLLTDQLDVSEDQASGGAGALFKMAKGSLPKSDYGKVSDAIPGIGDLIQSAPEAPEASEASGGLSEKIAGAKEGLGGLSKTVDNVNKLAAVKDQFSQLGMGGDMVSKFIPVILKYADSKGGETVMNLLKGAWQ